MPERILEWFEVTPPFQKITLIGVMVGLIGVGFYFSVAEPKIRDIQALRGEMQQIDQHSEEHYEELTHGEIAQELGIERSTANKRYFRALMKIKHILATMRGGPGESWTGRKD